MFVSSSSSSSPPLILPISSATAHNRVPSSMELRTHLTALGIIASLALLAIAPWIELSLIVCILLAACIYSIRPQPMDYLEALPMPHCMETVHTVYMPPQPRTYAHTTILPTRIETWPRAVPTPSGRAPVGRGAPTRFVPLRVAMPSGRAPVGTGAPTRLANARNSFHTGFCR